MDPIRFFEEGGAGMYLSLLLWGLGEARRQKALAPPPPPGYRWSLKN